MTTRFKSPQESENAALNQFPPDERGGRECQQILRNWFPRLRKQVDPNTAEYDQLISDAASVLEEIRTGIGGVFWLDELNEMSEGRSQESHRRDIWAWPTEEQVDEWAYRGTGRAGLPDLDMALADYLRRPWLQHDAIDISAINALLVVELAELVIDVKTGAALGKPNWSFMFSGGNVFAQIGLSVAGKIIGFAAAWIILPAVAFGLFVHFHEQEAIGVISIWSLYVLYRLLTIPARLRARKLRTKTAESVAERYTTIVKAWHAAQGSTVNPSRLKELVLAAEERGATFPSVIHTIIDRAIKRDATALMRIHAT